MDVQCREALRTLQRDCPKVAEWTVRLLDGEYTPGEVRALVPSLIEMAKEHGLDCLRALLIILRCVAAKFPKLWRAISVGTTAAGAGAAGATGGTATTGGTAAGGAAAGGAAFWASLLFLLFALGFLTWRVLNELLADLDIGTQGVMPCSGTGGLNDIMALSPREITTSSMWGRKASLQAAYDEAEADCQRLSGNCTGTCPPGMTCKAVVAVQSVEQWSTFPWFFSYTRLIYTCPCYCV